MCVGCVGLNIFILDQIGSIDLIWGIWDQHLHLWYCQFGSTPQSTVRASLLSWLSSSWQVIHITLRRVPASPWTVCLVSAGESFVGVISMENWQTLSLPYTLIAPLRVDRGILHLFHQKLKTLSRGPKVCHEGGNMCACMCHVAIRN